MEIHGLNKLTLVDYDQKTACTVFTGRCNMRCPFCQNATLVLDPASQPIITVEEVYNYLDKRHGLLDGVCITGGEPTLQKDLPEFIKGIKDRGFLVKLDTNGSNPELVRKLIEEKQIDYVAMDIKNSLESYSKTIGIKNYDTYNIEQTINILLEGKIDFEFRTTVVKQFHTAEDFHKIAKLIKGTKKYFLQKFVDSGDLICQGLSACSDEQMRIFCDIMNKEGIPTHTRGI